MRISRAFLVVVGSLLAFPGVVSAQWIPNGRALTTATNVQRFPAIAPDGLGGAIVTWEDRRSGVDYDIYSQRVSNTGVVQWAADGVAVCSFSLEQQQPAACSDDNGGAIIIWQDFRIGTNWDLFGQRLDSLGTALWTPNGLLLGGHANGQVFPVIASDGAGGAVYASQDYRAGDADVYVQRMTSAGARLWNNGFGVGACTATGTQSLIQVISDGAGGVIAAWLDPRAITNSNIYAQRVNATGVIQFAANGYGVCVDGAEQTEPAIATNGAGGAIIAWMDFRSGAGGTGYDIYAQNVQSNGIPLWTADGIVICDAALGQLKPAIVEDGTGGAILTWQNNRSDTGDIYAQRVDATGAVQWTADGVAICAASNMQSDPEIVSDGSGGAVIAWQDLRTPDKFYNVYAQRVDASGAVQWNANGVPLCTAASTQSDLVAVSDGSGGVVAAWTDSRSGPSDTYAMRARSTLTAVGDDTPAAVGIALRNYPNPFTGTTAVDIELSQDVNVTIDIFDAAGRRVSSRFLPNFAAGVHTFTFDGHDDAGRSLASGVYFCRASAGGAVTSTKMVLVR